MKKKDIFLVSTNGFQAVLFILAVLLCLYSIPEMYRNLNKEPEDFWGGVAMILFFSASFLVSMLNICSLKRFPQISLTRMYINLPLAFLYFLIGCIGIISQGAVDGEMVLGFLPASIFLASFLRSFMVKDTKRILRQ